MSAVALRDIAEAAGLLSVHASHFVETECEFAPRTLYEYTSCSRQRARRWWQVLGNPEGDGEPACRRQSLCSLAEELLVSELAARVSAALFVAHDAHRGQISAGPFGRHVLLDVLQAKHAVLSALLSGAQPLGALLRLNRLRRRTEHWGDLLLAQRGLGETGAEFACDRSRWQRFRNENDAVDSLTSQQLLLVSLRHAMPPGGVEDSIREGLQGKMLRLLLSLAPDAAFGRDGRLRTPALRRISLGPASDRPLARSGVRLRKHSAHPDYEILRRSFRIADTAEDDPGREP